MSTPDENRHWRYGLSPADVKGLLMVHEGNCWICRDASATDVDHDHACCASSVTCGECFRGVLCTKCNVGLGWLERRGSWTSHLKPHRDNVEVYLGVI
jgi:hypothetical protein